ncbi:MAG: sigma-70 family RNA polymerase sigma factor [Bacillota bacterium]
MINTAQNGDESAKEKLLFHNYPLIKSLVRRYLAKGVDYDDLFQLGCVGFLKAIKGFDPAFGVMFSTYAVPMILGEIKRFMRDDGNIKISRSIKVLYYKVAKFSDDYRKIHQNEPTISEIATALECEQADVVLAVQSARGTLSLFDKPDSASGNSRMYIEKIEGKLSPEKMLNKIALKDAIKTLDEREQKILFMRYFHDKTQGEIAVHFGVSQVQISRIESKIMQKLRKFF